MSGDGPNPTLETIAELAEAIDVQISIHVNRVRSERRLFDADALDRSKLHDFQELKSDYTDVTPDGWYDDAFEALQAQGHLHNASGRATGGAVFGRLSADGRLYVRSEEAA